MIELPKKEALLLGVKDKISSKLFGAPPPPLAVSGAPTAVSGTPLTPVSSPGHKFCSTGTAASAAGARVIVMIQVYSFFASSLSGYAVNDLIEEPSFCVARESVTCRVKLEHQ